MNTPYYPYLNLEKENLRRYFWIENDTLYLKSSDAKPIKVTLPFIIDERIGKIAGMLPDGSLHKRLYSVSFSQKKDSKKVKEFGNIMQQLFGVIPRYRNYVDKTPQVTIGSKTLCTFLNKCLGLSRSNELMRVPFWVWKSPSSVIKEYLRYAFAMEGSISHHSKASEIKFHSTSLKYLEDLQKLLKEKFDINSFIQDYYVKDYGFKYFLYFGKQTEVIKFSKIGFALESHQKRLDELIASYKNKAWEITLVTVFRLKKKIFYESNLSIYYPYLGSDSIRLRLRELIQKGYIQKHMNRYSLTNAGYYKAMSLYGKVKFTKLRTNPKENEERILDFLKINGKSYRNEIARKLDISPITTRDAIRRLIKQNKVLFVERDKFQRKYYQAIA